MEFRTAYSKAIFVDAGVKGPTMAKQAFRDECDINVILKRYEQTGVLPEIRADIEGRYGDFSEIQDYQGALNTVLLAQEMFEALPAKARDRFKNDPEGLIRFVADPKNAEEVERLGLGTVKKVTEDPKGGGVVTPPAKGVVDEKSQTPPASPAVGK